MRPVEPVEENHMAVPAALSLHRGLWLLQSGSGGFLLMEMTVCQDGKVSGVEALGGEHKITTSRASQHQGLSMRWYHGFDSGTGLSSQATEYHRSGLHEGIVSYRIYHRQLSPITDRH